MTDHDGNPISGLHRSDFTVLSGSNPLPIAYLREESSAIAPVSLVVVVDVSESMYQKTIVTNGDELDKVRTALNQAIGKLNQCDEVALVLIGGRYQHEPPLGAVTLAQPFTTDHFLVHRKMYSVVPSGEKRLSEGIRLGLETLSAAHYPNRALVLMTDGLDQAAIDQTASSLAEVRKTGVDFFVIGIGDPNAQESFLSKLRGTTRVDMEAVKKLAAEGGGWALSAKPAESDEGVSLAAALTTITERLGSGYAIGIDSSQGNTAPVVTLASHPGAVVRTDLVPPTVIADAAARRPCEVGSRREVVAPKDISNLPGYTEIAATVSKPGGSYVDGLSKRDFNLAVNGTPQSIDFFRGGEASPATVGILVDTSASMQPKLPQARAAIEEFVKGLPPQDQVFLFAFAGQPSLLQPLTDDHDALIRRLDLLDAYGQTALFDAIIGGIVEAQKSHNQRRALLVITDGMDNASSSSADDVVRAAKSSGVLVYSIGIGDPNAPQVMSVTIGHFVMGGDDTERVDAATLSRLASANGGKSYIIQKVGNGAELKKACDEISDDLHERHAYAIGFVAHAPRDYSPLTIPITLGVPAHNDYVVRAPASIPVPPSPD